MPRMVIRDCELSYREYGSGFPIVFVHSFLGDARTWQPQVSYFSKSYRCIVPELWGHGESGVRNERLISIEDLVQDIWTVLQNLEIESCFFVGHSLGGVIGTHLAHAHPEMFKGLVVMSAYLGAETLQKQKEYLPMINAVEETEFFAPEFVEFIAPYFFSSNICNTNPELLQSFKHALSAISFLRIPTVTAVGRASYGRESFLEALKTLQVPTLYMTGQEDVIRTVAENQEMTDLTPKAQLVCIPEAGHVPSLEQPDYVNQHLDVFLKKILGGDAFGATSPRFVA